MYSPHLLLTGRPGVGKTTVIQQVVAQLGPGRAGGFYTRERRRQGRRVGFEIVTLAGETALLATTGREHVIARPVSFGRYTVDLDAIEQVALPAVRQAWETERLVIIDEIGPMEIFSEPFCDLVWELLESGAPLLGTIVARPYRFADEVKTHPAVTLVEVTTANRDPLPADLSARLEA